LSEPARNSHGLLMTLRVMLEIVVVAVFVVTFVVQPSRIASESMEPTLKVGDILLVDKQSFAPGGVMDKILPPETVQRGDLAIFHFALRPGMELVKRVVGLPGDRLRMRAGRVWVNDAELSEPYAFYSEARGNHFRDDFPSLRDADANVDPKWWVVLRRSATAGEVIVPPGQYFVLGDNRNDSEDSRYWGFVPRAAMVGRPLVVDFATPAEQRGWVGHRLLAAIEQSWRSLRVVR
jgi:signal peptidase I